MIAGSRTVSAGAARSSAAPGNIAVLGCTGSIGRQTLDVVRANPGDYRVVAVAANSDVEQVAAQVREFKPIAAAMADPEAARQLRSLLPAEVEVLSGGEGVVECARLSGVHTVVCAVVGFAGFAPLLAAIESGKHVALANKESVVAAGDLVSTALQSSQSCIVPVDSEHNSIFQCLLGRGQNDALQRVVLTASGGPFLRASAAELARVTPEQAVRHPRWNMGPKISVDSATLMNKGLEVMEAAMLFGLPGERIHILIHPESIVHGLAEYGDGTVIAALFETDMRVPIAFALSYLRSENPLCSPGSACAASGAAFLDLAAKQQLTFFEPDDAKFPALRLCYSALALGGTAPAVLSAANEAAVYAFLRGEISFIDIPKAVCEVLSLHQAKPLQNVEDVFGADSWARDCASYIIQNLRESRVPLSP